MRGRRRERRRSPQGIMAGPGHRGRTGALAAFIILAGIALLVVFLPTLASLGPAQRFILEKAGEFSGLSLSARECAIGWVRGMRVKDLAVSDRGTFALQVGEIEVAAGVLKLLGRDKDIGAVRISAPTLVLPLTEPAAAGTPPAPGAEAGPDRRAGEGAPARGPRGPVALPLPDFDLRGTVSVEGGRVEFVPPGGEPLWALEDIGLEIESASLFEPMRLKANVGRQAAAEAELHLFREGALRTERLHGRAALRVDDLALGPLGALARRYVALPEIEGTVSAALEANAQPDGEWQVRGSLRARDLELRGEGLHGDEPRLDALSAELDVAFRSNTLSVGRCAITAPFGEAGASGALAAPGATPFPTGMLSVTARLDLAALAAQLPNTLAVRKDVALRSGAVVTELSLSGDGARLRLQGRAETRGLEAVQEGRSITLEQPVAVAVDARIDAEGPVLERLEVTSSFARLTGSGDLQEAGLTGALNIEQALREAAKFTDLGAAASGTVEVSARLGGLTRAERRFSVDVAAREVSVSGLTPGPVTHDELLVHAAGLLRVSPSGVPQAVTELAATVASDVFQAELSAARLSAAEAPGRLPSVSTGRIRLAARLEDLARMAETAAATNLFPDLRGLLTIQATADTEDHAVAISSFRADVTNLVIAKGEAAFTQPHTGLFLSGRLQPERGDLVLDRLELSSELLSLSGAGSVEDIANDRLLDLSGVMECDAGRVADLVAVFGGRGITMSGKAARPFRARVSLAGRGLRELLAGTEAEATLFVKQADLFGVSVSNLELPLTVGHSVATLDAEAVVNEGRLSAAPFIDARDETAVFAVPGNTQVLRDVLLTDRMASDLLGLVNPLFRGCAVLGGRMGLLLAECRVPVEEGFRGKMDISGAVNLREVRIRPGRILGRVFEIIALHGAEAAVPDQDVQFLCRDGRVEATPLKIVSGPYQLTLSGTVGVDGTLDYVAEVPVTEGMVNADVYRYVADARLKIFIGGTVAKPEISRRSLDETLGALLKQAAQKALLDEKARKALIDQGGKVLDELLKDRRIRF